MTAAAQRYLNRELSWLAFNRRVLAEAEDPGVPVLERAAFLAITASNLDEFFMVRIGGLSLLVADGVVRPDTSRLSPRAQLAAVLADTQALVRQQYAAYDRLQTDLAAAGTRRILPEQMSPAEMAHVRHLFEEVWLPVLTPQAVGAGRVFPLLPGLGLNLLVRLAPAARARIRHAIIPLPGLVPRVITLPGADGHRYVLLEDAVRWFAGRLFPGETLKECVTFRITRNADMAADEDLATDFVVEMQAVLRRRKTSHCVRLELESGASRNAERFLCRALALPPPQVYRAPGPLDLRLLRALASMEGPPGAHYPPWPAQPSPQVPAQRSLFAILRERPVLLLHPYEAYEPVLRLLDEAADDDDVLAIKQVLYRTSADSPLIAALRRAAHKGKHVTALVELKARFDEARNIQWARALEEDGVQVIYGVKGLKTHAKATFIVRREPGGIMRYMHFGTGNYNERTARLYSDISYMTCDPDLGSDLSTFFHTIAGYSEPPGYLKLAVAPLGLCERLLALIGAETERARQGQRAEIHAKVNSLTDPDLIAALYTASRAGVRVRLNVRGICCLRPGVRGLSENIHVYSIIDRYLEHARIYYFHCGGQPQVFIASADWMTRNLQRRIELMVPVEDRASRTRLIALLKTYGRDTRKSWLLQPDGRWTRSKARSRGGRSQEELYREAQRAATLAAHRMAVTFEQHRARADR